MSKLSQVQAVVNAVQSVFGENGVEFVEGMNVRSAMTKEFKSQINAIICAGFKAGEIEFKDTESNRAKLADDKLLRNYVTGLIDNHVKKDKRLNGNTKHEIAQPFSRHPQVLELKKLRTAENTTEIDGLVEAKIAELKAAAKVKTTTAPQA